MMEAVYAVLLHGEHVGAIHRRDAFTKFVFDRDYWDRPNRAVLGRWFEDHPRKQPRVTNWVPSWFSNLLPEGRLRELIAREQGVDTHREIDLLTRIGADLPGAVQVVPDPEAPVDEGFEAATDGLVNVPKPSARLRFSLAGMGLKFSMRQEGDRLVLPAHGEDGGWIVKTPDGNYPGLVANEAAVMRLAGELGIEVPEVHVRHRNQVDELGEGAWPSDEDEAYVVRRFDRTAEGRVHIEDFAQVLGRFGLGEGKYRSTVEAVAAIAYRGRDHASLQEMVRRTVFNLFVGNGDAHLKNWSLIYPDRKIARLSPAYDLVCTAVYPHQADLGLPFFGTARLSEISRDHFARLQAALNVDDDDVLDVVDEMIERFCQAWAAGAAEGLPTSVATWIEEHREQTRQQLTQT